MLINFKYRFLYSTVFGFDDKEMDRKFNEWRKPDLLKQVKCILALTGVMYIILSITNRFTAPDKIQDILFFYQFTMIASFAFLVAYLAHKKNYFLSQLLLYIAPIFAAIAHAIIFSQLDIFNQYQAELYLMIFWIYTISGMRLIHAISSSFIVFTIGVIYPYLAYPNQVDGLFIHITWLIVSLLFGFVGGYLMQESYKNTFLKQQELECLAAELEDKNKRLAHLTDNLQDEVNHQITLMRLKDQQLAQQSKMASLGEMMSFISHQWMQPLNTIGLMLQHFQLARRLGEKFDEKALDKLHNSVLLQTKHMTSTMRDFLKLSNSNLQKETFSLKHALHMVNTLVEASFIVNHITLNFVENEDDIELFGKESEIIHAVINIINNARDVLLERKSISPEVIVHFKQNLDIGILTITDNAGGISEDILPQIFEPYFSTKITNKGTGLGLHMSKKIIDENFEASLSVKNDTLGACFTLIFKSNA